MKGDIIMKKKNSILRFIILECTFPVLVLLCFFAGLRFCGNIPEQNAVSVVLSDNLPEKSRIQKILETEEENEQGGNACFFHNLGLITAKDPVGGRTMKVFLGSVLGNASLLDPRIRGFSEEDRDGCIIDRKSALALYGSTDVMGREVEISGRCFFVRGVVNWMQRVVLIRSDDRQTKYSRLFVDCGRDKQEETAENFLLRYGLGGRISDGQALKTLAEMAVFLIPVMFWSDLLILTKRQKKLAAGKRKELWKVCGAVFFLTAGYWIARSFRIPAAWIPGKWSDFSFWSKRIGEETEKLLVFFSVSWTGLETETAVCSGTAVFCTALAGMFYAMWVNVRKMNFSIG